VEEMKKDEALEEQQTTAEAAEATEAEAVIRQAYGRI
jgi:hypothetical protein